MTDGRASGEGASVGPHLARLLVQRIDDAIDELETPQRCLALTHPDDRALVETLPFRPEGLRALVPTPPANVFASYRGVRFAAIGGEAGVIVIARLSPGGDEPAAARIELRR